MYTDIFVTTPILNQNQRSWAYFKVKINVNNFTVSDFQNNLDKTGYESVFTRTGPRTAQDRVKPVLCGPVCGPSIFGNIRTGPWSKPRRAQDRDRTGL